MPQIKIECIKDFANFKAGEVFEFNQSCFLAGTNGSGKTTLLSALRATLTDSNSEKGYWDQRHEKYAKTLEYFSVTTDIGKEEALFLFGREDSGESQTYDAYSFLASGGYWAERQSKGESALVLIDQKLGTNKEALKRKVIIFDEVDTGFDFKNQIRFGKNLVKNLNTKFNCFMLVTTHNYLTLLNSNLPIYLLDKRAYVTVKELKEFFENDNAI
jgi:ABC-type Mn2+/Zn2+ transport system ATPase subunit